MHQIDENVNLSDIENLSNIYYQFIFNFFSQNLIFNFKYKPHAGAVGPAILLSLDSKISSISLIFKISLPILIRVPTIILT